MKIDESLDLGQRRLMQVVANARGVPLTLSMEVNEQGAWEEWFRTAHDVLSDELVDFGINGVVVNRYGLVLEDLIDRLADAHSRADLPEG